MAKSTPVLKSSVTKRQAEPVPSDMKERLQQQQHHQAAEADTADGASTSTEPAQSQELEPAPEPEGSPAPEAEAESTPSQEESRKQRKRDEQREAHAVQFAFLAGNLNKLVVIFLVNGLRLTGKLRQYDQFTVLLEGRDGISSMVFKHAISTIAPAR